MKILLTGANGLLGQKLIGLIASRGEDALIATGLGSNRNPVGAGYIYEPLDTTDIAAVEYCIAKHKPDVVIHTAAMTNVDQCEQDHEGCWRLNVHAVANLVESCRQHNAFLLHLSTDFIFDGAAGPYTEEATPNPLSFYGVSKVASEQLLVGSGINWAIARTILVYGIAHDMSRSNIILWVKKNLEEGKPIHVVNDQWRTPTLAEDLAMGCYLIAKQRQKGVFNISGKDLLTPYEMALMTADYFKLDKSLINETDGSKFSQPARRPARTGFLLDKAQQTLGYKPVSFEEGISILARQIGQ